MAIDPICKKTVDETTPFKSIYKNKEYYFCSEECKKKFDELDKSISATEMRICPPKFLIPQNGME
jgi:YHS domain-containing protein